MANTALVGDNHRMFHQVEPVGPFDAGTRLVSASAELALALGAIYPEPVPAGAGVSMFDVHR
jgi:hypothetical protein